MRTRSTALIVLSLLIVTAVSAGPARAANRMRHSVCGSSLHKKHEVVVDISRQHAWFCHYRKQVRSTAVTTGAAGLGRGTPTGTWRVYDKQRNTTLYPAAGGAYHVHYWMPYSGPYGLHDSPWQHFPYGSQRYRTHGSHGCVHVPEAEMRFLFRWAPIGTTVVVRR